jgi:hypothetical protein
MSLSRVLARTAEGNALIYGAIVADNGRFTDNNSHSVVDKEPLAYRCAGMDLDSRYPPCELAYRTRGEEMIGEIDLFKDLSGLLGVFSTCILNKAVSSRYILH